MIQVILRMNVLSEKRLELSQTIASLLGPIRAEQGCGGCDAWNNIENENTLCLLQTWDCRENLENHLHAGHFKVLRGAMNLLSEPYELQVLTDAPAKVHF